MSLEIQGVEIVDANKNWLGTVIPVNKGGTGATDAATARTNLGLGSAAASATTDFATAAQGSKADTALQPAAIGVSVQAYDADLTSWAAIAPSTKQDTLVSGTSIKTVNSTSLLGSGDIAVQPTLVSGTNIKTVNGNSLLGSGDLTISSGSSTLTIQNKTAAYTVVAGDNGTIINCTSGTFTVSLTAAATLGAGFNCWIWNTSTTATHAVTIDPAGTETVDGRATLLLSRGEGMQIVCDGTNWQTGDKKTMRGYAENMDPVGGARPSATGAHAISLGRSSAATADYSMALGSQANATAARSVAVGLNSSLQGSVTATGSGAMALGGSYASGTDSFAAAVANNTSSYGATGANAVAIGSLAKATGGESFSYGVNSQSTANYAASFGRGAKSTATAASVFGGYNGQASGDYSLVVGGTDGVANAEASVVLGGYNGTTDSIVGKVAIPGGVNIGYGTNVSQSGIFVLGDSTTDATAKRLTTNKSAAAATNQVILPNNSAYAFTGTIVARQQAAGGTASAAWEVKGLIRREGSAATTVLVNSALTVIDNQPGWLITLSADTTRGGLAITATGAAATNIRWVATIQTSEVTYA